MPPICIGISRLSPHRNIASVTGINRIAKTTEELANGNLNVDISALARRDELKSVVDSLNVFKSNAVALNVSARARPATKPR